MRNILKSLTVAVVSALVLLAGPAAGDGIFANNGSPASDIIGKEIDRALDEQREARQEDSCDAAKVAFEEAHDAAWAVAPEWQAALDELNASGGAAWHEAYAAFLEIENVYRPLANAYDAALAAVEAQCGAVPPNLAPLPGGNIPVPPTTTTTVPPTTTTTSPPATTIPPATTVPPSTTQPPATTVPPTPSIPVIGPVPLPPGPIFVPGTVPAPVPVPVPSTTVPVVPAPGPIPPAPWIGPPPYPWGPIPIPIPTTTLAPPVSTVPPTTQPPTTVPPTTQPPTTVPPTTQPPTTQPPTTTASPCMPLPSTHPEYVAAKANYEAMRAEAATWRPILKESAAKVLELSYAAAEDKSLLPEWRKAIKDRKKIWDAWQPVVKRLNAAINEWDRVRDWHCQVYG